MIDPGSVVSEVCCCKYCKCNTCPLFVVTVRKTYVIRHMNKVLPGFEPGFREIELQIKIPSDNHYTIAPQTP